MHIDTVWGYYLIIHQLIVESETGFIYNPVVMPERKEQRSQEYIVLELDKPVFPFDNNKDFNFRELQRLQSVLNVEVQFEQFRGTLRLTPEAEAIDQPFYSEGYEFPLGPARLAYHFDTDCRIIAEAPLRLDLLHFKVTSYDQLEYLEQFYGELTVGESEYISPCDGVAQQDDTQMDFEGLGIYELPSVLCQADEGEEEAYVLLPMDREKIRSIKLTIRKYDDESDQLLPTAPDTLVGV